MKRWALLLPVIFLVGLFAAFHATAATKAHKDTMVLTGLVPIGNGQYKLTVTQQSPETMITQFTFVPGPGLTITSVVSMSDGGMCTLSGRNVACNDTLALAPCTCQPGGSVDIVLSGSGDGAGSTLQVNGMTFAVTLYAGPTTTTTQTTTTTTTQTTTQTTTTTSKPPAPKPKKKVVPKCKQGHKSTKAHPCHK